MRWLTLICCLWPSLSLAEFYSVRTPLPAGEVLTPEDLVHHLELRQGAISTLEHIIGQETRVALYPGRPILPAQIGPPILIQRNQPLQLIFESGGLIIKSEGRSLTRASAGDTLRVINLASNKIITVRLGADGNGYANP